MRLATFRDGDALKLGAADEDGNVLDLAAAEPRLPATMLELIAAGPAALDLVAAALGANEHRHWRPAAGVTLAAPIPRPAKNVFNVGRNYRAHIVEGARARGFEATLPAVPEFFTKAPTAVIGPGEAIERHAAVTQQLDYEVELAVVIGRRVRDLPVAAALDAVFGYTILNDVTARDLQKAHGQWFKGKSLDATCPLGPWIVTADQFGPPSGHAIRLWVNGELRQDSDTGDLLFGVPEIIASLSAGMTLEPGDIISTGTPAGVAMGMTPPLWLQSGDVVEAEIEGIGRLRNPVAG